MSQTIRETRDLGRDKIRDSSSRWKLVLISMGTKQHTDLLASALRLVLIYLHDLKNLGL